MHKPVYCSEYLTGITAFVHVLLKKITCSTLVAENSLKFEVRKVQRIIILILDHVNNRAHHVLSLRWSIIFEYVPLATCLRLWGGSLSDTRNALGIRNEVLDLPYHANPLLLLCSTPLTCAWWIT